MIIKHVKEVTDWFITSKAPDLKEKVEIVLKTLDEGKPLEGIHKKLFGFMLFSFSMNQGPASFIGIELLAKELQVTEELKEYSNSWINSSKTKK